MTVTAERNAPQRAALVPASDTLETRIARATDALLASQKRDGHFVFELEADATIPAEYILYRHYLGEPNLELEPRVTAYLRRIQGEHGGWPLFHGGAFNMSATVKAYFALKIAGEPIDAPHMVRAREAVLAWGGAERSNVFTRNLLALFEAIPWHGVPVMPVEIMHLPRWFPFHLSKVSYWARTVLVPLLVLNATKPRARNPKGVRIDELFSRPPHSVRHWPKGEHQKAPWSQIFGAIDVALRAVEPLMPSGPRQRAITKAVKFVDERLNGEDGIGAIFPAMVNAVLMYDALGIAQTDPRVITARRAVEKLLVVKGDEAYCQPCVSPVWDTCLAAHALLEAGSPRATAAARAGLDWLKPLQVLDVKGDWAVARPDVRPGGWAFQYANPHYPDLDDTAVVVMAMHRLAQSSGTPDFDTAIARAKEWTVGLQSRNGGWGAFDADNTYHYLNHIPFADHGALLDPPTADVSARCVSMLAQMGATRETSPELARGLAYLEREQMPDGSWFGRWGVNYIYGTWSALCAFNAAGVQRDAPAVRKAVEWLLSIQNADGGWGEDCDSYALDYQGYRPAPSAASQTAWSLLALMSAGEADTPAVQRGIDWLASNQSDDGLWPEDHYTGTGFPRVFYLRYHGYSKFFPLWALARYRNLRHSNSGRVAFGM